MVLVLPLAVGLFVACAPLVAAQDSRAPAVREAERVRNAGDLKRAVFLLEEHISDWPDDGDAARLLAETLYWLKDVEQARAVYASALARHPSDERLRLQYARMLAETGDRRGARTVIEQVPEHAASRPEIDALLGTLAYWEGDLVTARALFATALRANPLLEDARRQIEEIDSVAASWIRISAAAWHDDQPLDRSGLAFEGGWFATPLTQVTARVEPARYERGAAGGTPLSGEAGITHGTPRLRLDTEAAVGFYRRPRAGDDIEWTGRAVARFRFPAHVALRLQADRSPYLHTVASLSTAVNTEGVSAGLHWSHPRGWMGEAAVRWHRYPDANDVGSVHAWVLAPVLHGSGGELQIGLASSWQDSSESRFALARPLQPYPPSDPRFDTSGRFDPYYTPSSLRVHSAIAAVAWRSSSGHALRLGASRALYAIEEAPAFVLDTGGQLQRVTATRTSAPWSVRAGGDIALGRGLALGASGEVGRNAFYRWATGRVQLTRRFGTAGRARNGGR